MRSSRSAALTFLARASVLAIVAGGVVAAPAFAQEAGSPAETSFNVPAGALSAALAQLGEQAGVSLVYPAELAQGRTSNGASGRMDVREALARVLAGTGLTFRVSGPKTIVIEAAVSADGERVLGAVRVEGAQSFGSTLAGSSPVNGVNGSRDVTATEGTGSYTSNALTVGSKTAQSIKETPMSVSVVTSQRIQDQNLTDLNAVMRNMPGVSVINNGSASDLSFYSRGFQITQLQIDGGAAQNFAINSVRYSPIVDLALYDHIEIVRGASGTFNAYGDPGGVLNLVRKRPLDHPQLLLEFQLGAWDWHRVVADVTGPIAFDGKLRARVIATHQDNDFFYDTANFNRNIISGSVDLDLTPTTIVTVGASYAEQNELPWFNGLPRYYDGSPLNLPRSACLCFNWARNDHKNTEIFGQIEQRLGSNWNVRVKLTRTLQKTWQVAPGISGAVDPATGDGALVGAGNYEFGHVKQSMAEILIDGSFSLFGKTHKVTSGVNYSMGDQTGSAIFPSGSATIFAGEGLNHPKLPGIFSRDYPVNINQFDSDLWSPSSGLYQFQDLGVDFDDQRYLNSYINVDLNLVAKIHLISGLRYSQFRSRRLSWTFCNSIRVSRGLCSSDKLNQRYYTGAGSLSKGSSFSWPPSVLVRNDFSDNISAYAGYTDIYIDRSIYKTVNGSALPPTTGQNFEGGVKYLSDNKKLNIALSGYYIKKINVDQIADPFRNDSGSNIGQLNGQSYCCFVNNDDAYDKSYGLDIEVSGEIFRDTQISASYTFNVNKTYRPGYTLFDGSSPPLQSQAPKHLFKLWMVHQFTRGPLDGLRLGLGANGQSKTFVSDSYCTTSPVLQSDGLYSCPSSQNVFFSDPGHVVFSASLGYKVSDNLQLDIQADNLFDKTYFETVGGLNSGNYYGAPRNAKVTLRGKF